MEKVLAEFMSLQQHLAEGKLQVPPEEVVNKVRKNLGKNVGKNQGF